MATRRSLLYPATLLLVGTIAVPFVALLVLSLTDFGFSGTTGATSFVGVGNYAAAAGDSAFGASLIRAAVFAGCATGIELLLGLAAAEIVLASTRRYWWLGWLSAPLALSSVSVALFWRLLLQTQFGPLGYWASQVNWHAGANALGSGASAFTVIIAVDVWQWVPLITLIIFALRLTQANTAAEAARVDGAGPVTTYFSTTLATLKPWLWLVGLLRFVEAFREFDKPFVLTTGGPGTATELMSLYLWRVVFVEWHFGYGAALTVLVYVLLVLAVLIAATPAVRTINASID